MSTFKVPHGPATQYIPELLVEYQHSRTSIKSYCWYADSVTHTQQVSGICAFSRAAPVPRNNLPYAVTQGDTAAAFKIALKTQFYHLHQAHIIVNFVYMALDGTEETFSAQSKTS